MTLQQLEYIVAVGEYMHFGKAAEACGVTQPTLSLMIKKLEDELDVQIFNRDSHPITFTEIGKTITEKAGVILYGVKQLQEVTKSEKELASGKVTIAMISTVAPILIPGVFSYIGKKYKQVRPQIEEMLSGTIISKLRRAEIDMGIVVSPVNEPDILEIPLYHEKFLAYVSPDHNLYKKEALESGKLLDNPIWIMKKGVRLFDKSMLEEGERFSYDKMYEGGRAGTLLSIINDLGGITIVPELQKRIIAPEMHKNLRPLVNPEVSRRISLAVRKDYIHEKMLNIVIEAIRLVIPDENQDEMIRGKGTIRL